MTGDTVSIVVALGILLIIYLSMGISSFELERRRTRGGGYQPRARAEDVPLPKPYNIESINSTRRNNMPDIERQKSSGALIFVPTIQERAMVDTQKELNAKSDELTEKLKEADELLAILREAKGKVDEN